MQFLIHSFLLVFTIHAAAAEYVNPSATAYFLSNIDDLRNREVPVKLLLCLENGKPSLNARVCTIDKVIPVSVVRDGVEDSGGYLYRFYEHYKSGLTYKKFFYACYLDQSNPNKTIESLTVASFDNIDIRDGKLIVEQENNGANVTVTYEKFSPTSYAKYQVYKGHYDRKLKQWIAE